MNALADGGGGPGDRRRGWRVGVVTPFLYPGGAEQATLDVLRCLDPARFRVAGTAVATASLRSDMMAREYGALGPVVYTPQEAVRLTAGCDVVLCWGVEVGPFLPHPGRRPAVVMVSHSTSDMPYAVESQARSSPFVDRFVAVSRAALSSVPPGRRAGTLVIPHAVDPARVTASRPREEVLRCWGVDPRSTVIGALGRLAPEKRPGLFVDVIAALPPGYVGVMAGAGLMAEEVRAYAARVAPGRVFFPGPVAAVGDALGAFDRLVHLASYESFGLALAEAMAAGVPVISTRVGFLAEYDGAARLVPPDADGRGIAEAVLRDLADRDGAARRAEEAMRLVAEAFDRGRYRRAWESVLAAAAREKDTSRDAAAATGCPGGGERTPGGDGRPSPQAGPSAAPPRRARSGGVTAVIAVERPLASLGRQLAAVRGQTVPPAAVWAVTTGLTGPDLDALGGLGIDRVVSAGDGDWPPLRFALALAAPTEFACVFDGGAVPGRRWFENCLDTVRHSPGVLGATGWTFTGPFPGREATPCGGPYRSGRVFEVDFVSRVRFLRPRWLSPLFAEPPTHAPTGLDAAVAARAWRLSGVRCFVPPQPADEPDLWGCGAAGDAPGADPGGPPPGVTGCPGRVDPAEVASGWEPLIHRHAWELFRNHARYPRNRGVPAGRALAGTATAGAGAALTLYLRPARSASGAVLIEQAGFESAGGEAVDAYASWLTERLTGAPLAAARGLAAGDLLRGLGPGPGRVGTGPGAAPAPGVPAAEAAAAAEAVAAALRDALGKI